MLFSAVGEDSAKVLAQPMEDSEEIANEELLNPGIYRCISKTWAKFEAIATITHDNKYPTTAENAATRCWTHLHTQSLLETNGCSGIFAFIINRELAS